MSRLILIRGNSGSGKTTIAKRLQQELQPRPGKNHHNNTMLVQQDVVRRDILKVHDAPNNPSIELIEKMVLFGKDAGYDVILEGILRKDYYGGMLARLINHFDGNVYTYYFNVSLEETLRRHTTKVNAHEFGEAEMQGWYREKDVLDMVDDMVFTDSQSEDEILQIILNGLGH